MLTDSEINIVCDLYRKTDSLVDIRPNVIVAYKTGTHEFVFMANKIGDFWYIKDDKEKHYEPI